jgi:hypothetical protein
MLRAARYAHIYIAIAPDYGGIEIANGKETPMMKLLSFALLFCAATIPVRGFAQTTGSATPPPRPVGATSTPLSDQLDPVPRIESLRRQLVAQGIPPPPGFPVRIESGPGVIGRGSALPGGLPLPPGMPLPGGAFAPGTFTTASMGAMRRGTVFAGMLTSGPPAPGLKPESSPPVADGLKPMPTPAPAALAGAAPAASRLAPASSPSQAISAAEIEALTQREPAESAQPKPARKGRSLLGLWAALAVVAVGGGALLVLRKAI